MNKRATLWQRFRFFINEIPDGTEFSRTSLKIMADESPSHPTTVDTYRRMCELAGYLEKGSKPGKYIKVKSIPRGASKNDIKEMAYGYRDYSTRNWL